MTAPRVRHAPNHPGEYRITFGGVIVGYVARQQGGWACRPPGGGDWLSDRHRLRDEAANALVAIAEGVTA